LLRKITPAAQLGSTGLHRSAPTSTSEPCGAFTTADLKSSYSAASLASRAASPSLPNSDAPETTTRVGSPAVGESTICTRESAAAIFNRFMVAGRPGRAGVNYAVDSVRSASIARDVLNTSVSGTNL
jgi:hypothetical protein